MSWRQILSWEVPPDEIPFPEFSSRVKPGDIWKFHNKDHPNEGFDFWIWVWEILNRDSRRVQFRGDSDRSLEAMSEDDPYSSASVTDEATVLEFVENRPYPGQVHASLWEVSRDGLDEAPRKGKRVKMKDGVSEGTRTYHAFVLPRGAKGTIVDPSPWPGRSEMIAVLWDGYPPSELSHRGYKSGWYIDLSDIEYI